MALAGLLRVDFDAMSADCATSAARLGLLSGGTVPLSCGGGQSSRLPERRRRYSWR